MSPILLYPNYRLLFISIFQVISNRVKHNKRLEGGLDSKSKTELDIHSIMISMFN